jgi:hypothetical protein
MRTEHWSTYKGNKGWSKNGDPSTKPTKQEELIRTIAANSLGGKRSPDELHAKHFLRRRRRDFALFKKKSL